MIARGTGARRASQREGNPIVSPKDQDPKTNEGYVDPRYADVKKREGGPGSGRHPDAEKGPYHPKHDIKSGKGPAPGQKISPRHLQDFSGNRASFSHPGNGNRYEFKKGKDGWRATGDYEMGAAESKRESRASREVAPPGREKQVKKLKKKFGTPSAFKIAWSQHNASKESKTKESTDPNAEPYNMMGDFLNAQRREKPTPGWKNSNVYSPNVNALKQQTASNVVIKEF